MNRRKISFKWKQNFCIRNGPCVGFHETDPKVDVNQSKNDEEERKRKEKVIHKDISVLIRLVSVRGVGMEEDCEDSLC
jgi:hypothetical protein